MEIVIIVVVAMVVVVALGVAAYLYMLKRCKDIMANRVKRINECDEHLTSAIIDYQTLYFELINCLRKF